LDKGRNLQHFFAQVSKTGVKVSKSESKHTSISRMVATNITFSPVRMQGLWFRNQHHVRLWLSDLAWTRMTMSARWNAHHMIRFH